MLLILSIAISTENFTIKELIKEAHKFIYKSLVEERNYLESDSKEKLLLPYIAVTKKDKNKLSLISLPLVVLKGSKDSISPLLP